MVNRSGPTLCRSVHHRQRQYPYGLRHRGSSFHGNVKIRHATPSFKLKARVENEMNPLFTIMRIHLFLALTSRKFLLWLIILDIQISYSEKLLPNLREKTFPFRTSENETVFKLALLVLFLLHPFETYRKISVSEAKKFRRMNGKKKVNKNDEKGRKGKILFLVREFLLQ